MERRPWRSFVGFLGAGVIGAALAIPVGIESITALLEMSAPGSAEAMSRSTMAAMTMLNPILLVLVATAAGHLLAHRAALTSLVVARDRLSAGAGRDWIRSLAAVGITVIIGDLAFRPFVPAELSLFAQRFSWYRLALGLVYGGVVEEIIMRWGLMTVLVWTAWKLFDRKAEQPRPAAAWIGIVLSAALFGLAHYGVTAALAEMTAPVFIRMILLNGIGGVVFGVLYWKRNLETAVFAHMAAHVTMNVAFIVAAMLR